MTSPTPPLWNQAPAARRGPPSPAKRYELLGNVCLVLSILELLNCLQRILSQLFSHTLVEAQRGLLPSLPKGPPVQGVMSAAEAFMAKIAIWEAVRTIPFLVATAFLLWIAMRLRRADASALFTARRWAFGALGVVAVSLVIQILFTVPATLEYQRAVVEMIPVMPTGRGATPLDVKGMTAQISVITTLLGVAGGVAFFSAWPIVLYVWAGKLIQETAPARA